jgi:hypothetical protein
VLLHRDVPEIERRGDGEGNGAQPEPGRKDDEGGNREHRDPQPPLVPRIALRLPERPDPSGHVVSGDNEAEEDRKDRQIREPDHFQSACIETSARTGQKMIQKLSERRPAM